MSHRSKGFVRNSRYGSGPVIPGTNRDITRSWRSLGIPEPRAFAHPDTCEVCQAAICNCRDCQAFKGAHRCWEHRAPDTPGHEVR